MCYHWTGPLRSCLSTINNKMPVKRTLRMENNDNTPAKRPAPIRNYSPLTGTYQMSPSASPQAGKAKASGKTANSHKPQVPQTEVEILHAISSKLEASVGAFIKARQELKKIVAAEGSSELKSFFSRGSADLKTELRRHRELASKAESSLRVNGACQSHLQGVVQTGSSSDFLKSIMAL